MADERQATGDGSGAKTGGAAAPMGFGSRNGAVANAGTPSNAAPALRWRGFLRGAGRLALLALVPAALTAVGGYYYVTGGRIVGTENAYVKADKIAVSTDLDGRVIEVMVDENDRVAEGQILFRLDEEPFRIALFDAEAKLGAAKQEIETLRAVYRQEVAAIEVIRGDIAFYSREFNRQRQLGRKGFASQSKLDEARRNMRTAQQRELAVEQDIQAALARLSGNPDLPVELHPEVRAAAARRDQAALDLRRTVVRAPASGIVTNIELQKGEYVEEGEPIFSIVSDKRLWVQANLKETDLTHVRVGQGAVIRVDAYPDLKFRARVVSIAPATGAEFAILPPQNATGNWVKVVQRIPVRLGLEPAAARADPLRAGMSVAVDIDTGHERALPSFAAKALAWVNDGE